MRCKWFLLPGLLLVVSFGALRWFPPYTEQIETHRGGVVSILRDDGWVPHLTVNTQSDADYATGWIHAEDRLWQMDMLRRLGSGRMAEIIGAKMLEFDQVMRTLSFWNLAKENYAAQPLEVKVSMLDFTNGINDNVKQRWILPLEYWITWSEWEEWHPSDVFVIQYFVTLQLNITWAHEILYDAIESIFGEELAAELLPHTAETLPEQITMVSSDELPSELRKGAEKAAKPSPPTPQVDFTQIPDTINTPGLGSNAWVIGGQHTKSGHAILANDPHVGLSHPALFHQIDISIKEGPHYAGHMVPGVNVMILGRNEHVAWGCTSGMLQQHDIFVHEINPENPQQYLFDGKWVGMSIRKETIKVRGGEDQEFQVRVTNSGPLLDNWGKTAGILVPVFPADYSETHRFSFNFSLFHIKDTSIIAMKQWHYAKSVYDIRRISQTLTNPQLAVLSIDSDDNIAYQSVGTVPIRATLGHKPKPGWSSEFAWSGFIPSEELPYVINPEKGYIMTCNNRPVTEDYKYYDEIGQLYLYGRSDRLSELIESSIASGRKLTADDMLSWQTDTHNTIARKTLPHMLKIVASTPETVEKISALESWDYYMSKDSKAASIYANWHKSIASALVKERINHDGIHTGVVRSVWYRAFLQNLLSKPNPESPMCVTESTSSCAELLTQTLISVPEVGSWGEIHQATIRHIPFGRVPLISWIFNTRIQEGGNDVTLNNAIHDYANESFDAVHGAAIRMIIENKGDSYWNLNAGESGNILSVYYNDRTTEHYNGKLRKWDYKNNS